MGRGYVAHVHNISIIADRPDMDLSTLRAASNILPGTQTYSIDLATLNTRISSVPGVKSSAVRRLPNGNISIHTKIYNTVGIWYDSEHYYPISDDGVVINKPSDTRPESAIMFRGKVPNNLTKITNASHELVDKIDYLEWIEDRRWNIHTTNGITILLPQDSVSTPEYEPTSAIAQLIYLDQNYQILSRTIERIDLRDPKRILDR